MHDVNLYKCTIINQGKQILFGREQAIQNMNSYKLIVTIRNQL